MGIDYGTRRIGVALSDPLRIIAGAFTVLDARSDDLVDRIAAIALDQDVDLIVVGLPVALSGREGESAVAARKLADAIRENTGLPVELSDERFTTKTAREALLEGDVKRRRRKEVVDKVAAAVMLQNYLDRT